MGGFSVDLMFQIIARRHVILPIDNEYDIYSPHEFEIA
jgi:hypothetical protein